MKIEFSTLRSTTMLTAGVYGCALLSVLVPRALCASFNGPIGGQHIHQFLPHYQHQQHQQQLPVYSHSRDMQLSAADAMYLQPNHGIQLQQQQQSLQHQYHLDDSYLKESAKNPKNLRNGVYQHGAVTYDLGMPHYEILNPHEPPEIITSDQPNYQQHLKQLHQTQNFTLEDFGVTAEPPTPTPTTEATTTTTTPEQQESEDTATTEQSTTTTASSKDLKDMQKHIEKELSKTKEKLQKLSEQIKIKCDKNKVYTSQTKDEEVNFVLVRKNGNLRKKMRPTPFKAVTPCPQPIEDDKYEPERPPLGDKSHDLQDTSNLYVQSQQSRAGTPSTDPRGAYENSPPCSQPNEEVKQQQQQQQQEMAAIPNQHNLYAQSPSDSVKSQYDSSLPANPQSIYANSPPYAHPNEEIKLEPEMAPITDKSHDLQNAHNLYVQSPSDSVKSPYGSSATDPQAIYGHSPSLSILPKYPPYHPYQGVQNSYNDVYNLPDDQSQMSLNSLHRLYRSASFLTTPEKKEVSSASVL